MPVVARLVSGSAPRFGLPKPVPILIAYLLLNIKKKKKKKKKKTHKSVIFFFFYAKSKLHFAFSLNYIKKNKLNKM
jgi:hypothetical protein